MLNKEIMLSIENELYKQVISPIESYIKPKMTGIDKVRAKANSYDAVKKAIENFCKENGVAKEDVVSILISSMENHKNKNNELQFELVNDMVENTLPQKDNDEKSY